MVVVHCHVAPILIDPLMEGLRYVPTQIAQRMARHSAHPAGRAGMGGARGNRHCSRKSRTSAVTSSVRSCQAGRRFTRKSWSTNGSVPLR